MLHPNATCRVKVQFQPTTVGLRTATVSLMDDSPDGPHVVHLQGTGTNELRPSAQIYAQTYSFGNQPINTTSKPLTVSVISRGATNLTIGAVAVSGGPSQEFRLRTGCSGRTLQPKEYCEIEVSFHPTAVKDFRARISVPHDASDAPNYFDVDGTGFGSQVSWCCAEGKLSKTDENTCKSLGGQSYSDALTAIRMCASTPKKPNPVQLEAPSGLEPGTPSQTNSPVIACESLTLHWSSTAASGGYFVLVSKLTTGTATALLPRNVYSERTAINEFKIPSSLEAGSYEWTVTSRESSSEKSAPAPLVYFICRPRILRPGMTRFLSPTLLKSNSSVPQPIS